MVEELRRIAAEYGLTQVQLAIAWVLAKGPRIVPVIGSRTRTQLAESLAAVKVQFRAADMARIEERITPESIGGARYDEGQMRVLDSER